MRPETPKGKDKMNRAGIGAAGGGTAATTEAPAALAACPPGRLALNFRAIEMTDEQLVRFCADNRDLRIELTSERELIVMPPASMTTGWQNARLNACLCLWTERDGSGLCFDSSAGFTLPNGAVRSADAAWMARERWESLDEAERHGFSRIVPDFVAELRSSSDNLAALQAKMTEYVENGLRLGWLIDPRRRRVHVYRPGRPVETLENPETVSGEAVLPGFTLNLRDVW